MPSCTSWFSFNDIHEIEVQSLPEFFCGRFPQKTPQVYLNWRNFIISLFHAKPLEYLSATECRNKIAGDICAVIRLHAFLEHWGLINFNVSVLLRPPKLQLGNGQKVSPDLLDIVSKGYLKLADAEALQKQKGESSGNPENLTFISTAKVNALSKHNPVCNACGQTCQFSWYMKKSI